MKISRFWYYPEASDSIHQLHPAIYIVQIKASTASSCISFVARAYQTRLGNSPHSDCESDSDDSFSPCS